MEAIGQLGSAGLALLVALPVLVVLLFWIGARRYRRVGPNQVMIISGRNHQIRREEDGTVETVGYRVRIGGGAFVWPGIERVDILSLEIGTLDIVASEIYTRNAVPLQIESGVHVKIRSDAASVRAAAECYLGKTGGEIHRIVCERVEARLRSLVGRLTVEEIHADRDGFCQRLLDEASAELRPMGIELLAFNLREIRDSNGYLETLGAAAIADARRKGEMSQVDSERAAAVHVAAARLEAEMARIESETRIAEAARELAIKKATLETGTSQQASDKSLALELQKLKAAQEIKREELRIVLVEKEGLIEIEEKENRRRELELEGRVKRAADADRYRIEMEASAHQFQIEAEAAGRAEAIRVEGQARADALVAAGEAEARVAGAAGAADAASMLHRAKSLREFDQAARLDLFLKVLPEVARAVAEPLARARTIGVSESTGEARNIGVSHFTEDVTRTVIELSATLAGLAGLDLEKLLGSRGGAISEASAPRIEPARNEPGGARPHAVQGTGGAGIMEFPGFPKT